MFVSYSLEYLLFGKGNLYAPGRYVAITRLGHLPGLYMGTSVLSEGRYNELYDRLVKEFVWDIPFVNGNKETLMKIRKFFLLKDM